MQYSLIMSWEAMLSKYFVKKVRTKNFDDHLKELFTELEDKKILLYGAGDGFEYLLDKYPFKDLNIVAIADKEFTQETVFKGMKAISPDAIIHQSYDIILITYEYAPSIIMHLQDDLKIEDKKIKIIFKNSIPEERESFLYLEKYNFKKRLNKLNNKLKNKKIVIYGGGVFFQALKEYYDLSNLNIIGIADIKFENHLDGEKFLGYPVLAPNEIKGVNPDYVLVATKFFDRLIEKLRYETLNETKIKIRSLISESFLTLLKEVFFLRKNKTKGRYVPQKYKSKKDLPTKFRIEASSICQLKCKECYMRAMDKTKAPGCGYGYLKFKDYKNFIDKNVVTSVELSDNGEIFLNPELLDIVKYSYKKNVKLTAENGVNFNDVTDEMLEALVKYKFEFLAISLDGASQETYVQYRVGGDFNKIIDNIKKVNFYKEKYNSEYPTLSWKFILFGHNEHEITKARITKVLAAGFVLVFIWLLLLCCHLRFSRLLKNG